MVFPPDMWAQTLDQLACRTIMQIVRPAPQQHSASGFSLGSLDELETDTIQLCTRFINAAYEKRSSGHPCGSFVDAYDLLSAAVILTCLQRSPNRRETQHIGSLLNSINKATTLVTQIAGRFPALRAFQDTLLKVSACLMEAPYGGDEVLRLQDIPSVIPRRLRHFLQNSFQ